MPNINHRRLFPLALGGVLLLTGCGSTNDLKERATREFALHAIATQERVNQADREALAAYTEIEKERAEALYQKGVEDTLREFRGRRNARKTFVWEPPVVENVEMPAQVINGAMYPSHRTPVIVSPGRWVYDDKIAVYDNERHNRGQRRQQPSAATPRPRSGGSAHQGTERTSPVAPSRPSPAASTATPRASRSAQHPSYRPASAPRTPSPSPAQAVEPSNQAQQEPTSKGSARTPSESDAPKKGGSKKAESSWFDGLWPWTE